ncbi:penicillin-binding transpeptidase domain-containing protein [Escherichia coli]|uniref:penicillin-binding transpeptidase domain-containing protein n=1 Tax=Escherichia coli TaxID=562 RepID=UPI000F51D484|nr:penicillin-binding transpeptidase domain-containing protein [Escherichia coli]
MFLLYDASTNAEIAQFNKAKCATQMAPDSTFKIALSLWHLMEIIDQKPYSNGIKPQRNGDLEQQSYTKDVDAIFCCLGFARNNPKIGLNKIKNYLKDFDYGNQDFWR